MQEGTRGGGGEGGGGGGQGEAAGKGQMCIGIGELNRYRVGRGWWELSNREE